MTSSKRNQWNNLALVAGAILLSMVQFVYNLAEFGHFAQTLEVIAGRNNSDERFFYNMGICLSENWAAYYDRCTTSPKGFLLVFLISIAQFTPDFAGLVFASLKFTYFWMLIIVGANFFVKFQKTVPTSLVFWTFSVNVYLNHYFVQLLRDEMIVATTFALICVTVEFFRSSSRSLIILLSTLLLCLFFLRPQMAIIFLLFIFLQLSFGSTIRKGILAIASFFVIGWAIKNMYGFDLLLFSPVTIARGFQQLLLSPLPTNAFLGVGDMQYAPLYSVFSFFISVFGIAICLVSIGAKATKFSSYRNPYFVFATIYPIAYLLLYALLGERDIRGPRQGLPAASLLFIFHVLPVLSLFIRSLNNDRNSVK